MTSSQADTARALVGTLAVRICHPGFNVHVAGQSVKVNGGLPREEPSFGRRVGIEIGKRYVTPCKAGRRRTPERGALRPTFL